MSLDEQALRDSKVLFVCEFSNQTLNDTDTVF